MKLFLKKLYIVLNHFSRNLNMTIYLCLVEMKSLIDRKTDKNSFSHHDIFDFKYYGLFKGMNFLRGKLKGECLFNDHGLILFMTC